MIKEYPKFERGQIEEVYNKLSSSEKKTLQEYLEYRKARGVNTEDKIKDIRRIIIQLRFILQKPFTKMDLKDLRGLIVVINTIESNYSKNNLKVDLKNFLKFVFPDWSLRFSGFDDIKLGKNGMNQEKINSNTLIKKEDIDKLIKHETKLFWKAYLLTQYEGGLRTKETSSIKWDELKLNVDGDITELNIFSTKTKNARTVFLEKSTHYLKLLQEEQEHSNNKGIYVFHAPKDKNKPIHKSTVNMWFRSLTKKVLGVQRWNYILRHSRATELYSLAHENKISKDTAIKFMGHSDDMSKTYTHLDSKDVKEMLKNQVYKIEDLPKERQHELEKKVDELEKKLKRVYEENQKIGEGVVDLLNTFKGVDIKKLAVIVENAKIKTP